MIRRTRVGLALPDHPGGSGAGPGTHRKRSRMMADMQDVSESERRSLGGSAKPAACCAELARIGYAVDEHVAASRGAYLDPVGLEHRQVLASQEK